MLNVVPVTVGFAVTSHHVVVLGSVVHRVKLSVVHLTFALILEMPALMHATFVRAFLFVLFAFH